MTTISVNRGSDLTLNGVWRDSAGTPINMTGWAISPFEAHPSISDMTVEWVDASVGTFRARVEWSDLVSAGQGVSFRLRVTREGDSRSSPEIRVNYT
jgi:hypothetical protein